MITSQDVTSTLKLEAEWTNIEDNKALGNSKAFNAIFNGVDIIMFIAKDAREIFKTTHEGTSKVRLSRL